MRVVRLAVVMLAWASADVAAQQAEIPVQAGVTINRDTVTVGDVVVLRIRVHAPQGATINFPTAVDSLGPVQALDPPVVTNGADSASAADRVASYRLSAWDVGKQQITLGEVLVQTDEGERHVALTLPSLFVQSVLPADTTLRVPKPARPLLGARVPFRWWWYALAAAAVIVTGLGIWWWMRRRRGAGETTGDPYADAAAAFDRVERLGLIGAGEPGRHAALMTDVTRRYLSNRIEAASLSQTSQELLSAVRGSPTVSYDELRRLLEKADVVKFAAAPISPDAARTLGDVAKMIVTDEHERAAAIEAAKPPAAQEKAA